MGIINGNIFSLWKATGNKVCRDTADLWSPRVQWQCAGSVRIMLKCHYFYFSLCQSPNDALGDCEHVLHLCSLLKKTEQENKSCLSPLTRIRWLTPGINERRGHQSVVSRSIDNCWWWNKIKLLLSLGQSASAMIHSSIYLYWWWTQAVVFIFLSKICSVPFGRSSFLSVCLRDTVRCQHIV